MAPYEPGSILELSTGVYELLERLGGACEPWKAKRGDELRLLKIPRTGDTKRMLVLERAAQQNLGKYSSLPPAAEFDLTAEIHMSRPYVPGETFHDRIENAPLSFDDLDGLIYDLCFTLDYCHKRGVVHRDVKPQNILLTPDNAVLMDFGLALTRQGNTVVNMGDEKGMVLGTPDFIPKEVWRGNAHSPKSDVYSLAVSLWFALAGRLPFVREIVEAIGAAHCYEKPPSVSLYASVPQVFAQLLDDSLAKNPADRPTPLEFLARYHNS